MKAWRKVKMEVDHFEIGDQIKIKLKDYGKFTATCHKINENKHTFVFDNCICSRPMNESGSTEGGFPASDMCTWLNTELIDAFPDKIVKRMVKPKDSNDLLWLLSEDEVFGLPDWKFRLMDDPKYRVCSYPDGSRANWWLRDVCDSTGFAYVTSSGYAYNYSASASYGVRPAFILNL